MKAEAKIISFADLPAWRQGIRQANRRLVVTNGCFDILHAGHVKYLEGARCLGDALLVGLNSDSSVREVKGPDRPINSEQDRATVLAALASVDGVCIFDDRDATRFLRVAGPDVYAKGGDYTLESLNQAERKVVEQGGGEIVILPLVPGKSTTATLERLTRGNQLP